MWKVPKDVCANTVYEAIKAGYRMFDSSSDYANEPQSGEGMQRAIKEGLVKREELFIVSKLWNTFKVGKQPCKAFERYFADIIYPGLASRQGRARDPEAAQELAD